jgi:hypothetical protein
MRIINVRESNAWKTGAPACHGKQASRLLLQPRQAGKPVWGSLSAMTAGTGCLPALQKSQKFKKRLDYFAQNKLKRARVKY